MSYAQNGEDVVLWRALHAVTPGRYVEVGANDPTSLSISKAFYDRGWSGIAIEPVPAFAEAFRAARPRDIVVEAAITSEEVDEVVMHQIADTGLSTLKDEISAGHAGAGWPVTDITVPVRRLDAVLAEHLSPGEDIHFLVIDTEGTERQVLETLDLARWRPWVMVIEATAPLTARRTHEEWEKIVLAADYDFVLFDGLSRWYVARERDHLVPALDHPASPLDEWVGSRTHASERLVEALRAEQETRDAELAACRAENEALLAQVVKWRGEVLARWAEAASTAVSSPGAGGVSSHESARLRTELEALQKTVSWRVTAPLRSIRTAQLRRSRRA